MSFAELAELVRSGKVTENTRVARAGSMNWEPAWHVPGLLRAAGITEPGDSPVTGSGFGVQGSATGAEIPAAGTQTRIIQNPKAKIQYLLRGIVATAIGVLAVGFFYRWASQAALVFPMPTVEVDGETIDCYFPLVGRCTVLECGLLYVDVFAVAAVATWHAAGRRVGSAQ